MRGVDLVVAVGADQQQMPDVALRQKVFQQVERSRVEPLQVIEEQRQRMFRAREDTDEPPQHRLEPALGVLRRHIDERRLRADDELQLGDQVHDQPRRSRPAPRQAPFASGLSSASLLTRIWRTSGWKACASVA